MKIRSITVFATLHSEKLEQKIKKLAQSTRQIKSILENAGLEVQTTRLATQSFPSFLKPWNNHKILALIKEFEKQVLRAEFDYLAIGPAVIEEPKSYELIPKILAETKNVFCSAVIADLKYGVSLRAVQAASQIIVQSSSLEKNGFANLRFTAMANVEPMGPFFPASYHDPDRSDGFAFAIEAADEVLKAFSKAKSLEQARADLLNSLERKASNISNLLKTELSEDNLHFYGFDFSVAPFPSSDCSLGAALESLGINALGDHGSLAAAAFLADTLDRGNWLRTGFNGLMLPLLEDSQLAQRAIDSSLSVKDLLMYSAVCGTGLDTIPLAGDLKAPQIAALLLDIAALSSRLKKPLTARLMPIPGKKVHELTSFDFAFFKNSRILDLQAHPLGGLFANSNETIQLHPRQTYKRD
ncbi:MAG: hypothetical protein BGO78_04050 [Chloroflexi bacterium 44-23]|nr:MAG: hypothetical protein BGO78_04050 [Chloroflexi bacterium 44-23]